MSTEAKISTAAYDPRFPYTNVTKMCWTNYVDYHRCARIKGDDSDPACAVFKKNFKAVCPESSVRQLALASPSPAPFIAKILFFFSHIFFFFSLQVEKWDAQREAGVFPGQQLIKN